MTGRSPTEHDSSSPGEGAKALLEGLTTDVLQDNLHTLASSDPLDLGGELLLAIVDAVGGAQLFGALQLFGRAGGDDNPARAEQLGDLDAGAGDSRAGGMNQYVFRRAETGPRGQHIPGGHEDQWDGRRLDVGEATGQGEDVAPRYRQILGVATVALFAQDSVVTTEHVVPGKTAFADAARDPWRHQNRRSDPELLCQLTRLGDFACYLAAGDQREGEAVSFDAVA